MSEPINDGGPAFPLSAIPNPLHEGMSLRDYFAAQSLVGVMNFAVLTDRSLTPEKWAKAAYDLADAMIAARKEKA